MKQLQRGASMISVMIMILIGAAFLTVALKLLPIYLDSWTITKAIDKVMHDPDIGKIDDHEIINRIATQLSINSIQDFDVKSIKIIHDEGKNEVQGDYEVRTHIVRNIDAVLTFKNHYAIPSSSE